MTKSAGLRPGKFLRKSKSSSDLTVGYHPNRQQYVNLSAFSIIIGSRVCWILIQSGSGSRPRVLDPDSQQCFPFRQWSRERILGRSAWGTAPGREALSASSPPLHIHPPPSYSRLLPSHHCTHKIAVGIFFKLLINGASNRTGGYFLMRAKHIMRAV